MPRALFCLVPLFAACSGQEHIERMVTLYLPLACGVPENGYGTYTATGDFQPSVPPAQIFVSQFGAELPGIPAAVRSLSIDLTDTPTQGEWRGVSIVTQEGPIDVFLWPTAKACAFNAKLGSAKGRAATMIDNRRLFVAGGSPIGALPGAFLFDTHTGKKTDLTQTVPRARASVTGYRTTAGAGAVVAGGVRSDDGTTIMADADILDETGAFGATVPLSAPRVDHGAVTLTNGMTLLVGGRKDSATLASVLELVDPVARHAGTSGMPLLAVPRTLPTVLRLASGEIMVAGGVDQAGQPVSKLEFFSADGRAALPSTAIIPARPRMAFVALEGGGALCIMAPEVGDPSTFQNTWIVSTDRGVSPAPSRVLGPLTTPRLFHGAGGFAVLWTGAGWLRWDPWSETFGASPALGDLGPPAEATAVSIDAGLLAWIGEDGTMTGARFDTRNAFTSDVPLLTTSPSLLAPDRPPSLAGMVFDAQGLSLPAQATAFVADTRYADVTIDVDFLGGAPHIVFRSETGVELDVGGSACPYAVSGGSVRVTRVGASITITSGSSTAACPTTFGTDRVAVGVRGPTQAKNLRLIRTPPK